MSKSKKSDPTAEINEATRELRDSFKSQIVGAALLSALHDIRNGDLGSLPPEVVEELKSFARNEVKVIPNWRQIDPKYSLNYSPKDSPRNLPSLPPSPQKQNPPS